MSEVATELARKRTELKKMGYTDSIIRLEKMGYTFTVKNGDIEIGFTSGTIPSVAEVERLMEHIGANKQAAIQFLKQREIQKNHRAAVEKDYLPYALGYRLGFKEGKCQERGNWVQAMNDLEMEEEVIERVIGKVAELYKENEQEKGGEI